MGIFIKFILITENIQISPQTKLAYFLQIGFAVFHIPIVSHQFSQPSLPETLRFTCLSISVNRYRRNAVTARFNNSELHSLSNNFINLWPGEFRKHFQIITLLADEKLYLCGTEELLLQTRRAVIMRGLLQWFVLSASGSSSRGVSLYVISTPRTGSLSKKKLTSAGLLY